MSNGQQSYNNEDRGVLFANTNQTNPQAPAVTGKIQLSKAMLKKLVNDANAGLPPIVRLAGWTQQKQDTNEFYTSLKATEWDHNWKAGGQQGAPQPQQQQPQPQQYHQPQQYQPPQQQQYPQQPPQQQQYPQQPPQQPQPQQQQPQPQPNPGQPWDDPIPF